MECFEGKYPAYAFRQTFILILLNLVFQSNIIITSGQCIDTADFSTWINVKPSSQSWTVLSPDKVMEVEESIPPVPNFFVSRQELIDVRFAFEMTPMNSPDQDFIGFVVGYINPFSSESNDYRFILFDWKAKAEVAFSHTAEEGFTLMEFHGVIASSDLPDFFWGHNGLVPNSICTPIDDSYGEDKGWQAGKSYHFEVTYTTGNLMIELDGNKIFDIDRYNQPGRIGFYTYSQHDVIFSNFTWKAATYANIYPASICTGDSAYFSMENPNGGGYNTLIQDWQWIFGDGSSLDNTVSGYHIYQSPGTFPVQFVARFPGGCSDTVTNIVCVQAPVLVDLGPDITLPANASITLTAGPDQYGWSYVWSNGNALHQVILENLEHDTTVWVSVLKDLCSGYDEIHIHIEELPPPSEEVLVPNAFSPNGDGINDVFKPKFKDELPEHYSLVVYNRWGQEIFESLYPTEGWNGKTHEIYCPGDIYVYLIKYSSTDRNMSPVTRVKKGTVMLVR